MNALILGLLLTGCGPKPQDIADQLSSTNPAVREDTTKRAGSYDDEVVIAALIKSLDDPSEKVRYNAIDSLITLKAKDAVPRLTEVMVQDDSADVRKEAIDALGCLADPRAGDALVALLEQTENAQPPLNAIWALGQLGDQKALPVLSRLRESHDPYVAYNANLSLRRLRPAGSEG